MFCLIFRQAGAGKKSSISASPSAQDIITPFDNNNGNELGGNMGGVEISGMKIMKSLPVLNKQVSQPPDSARGDNNSYYHK